MADGQEIRAQIDTETVRGLQLVNGGMAAGLVTLLPAVLRDSDHAALGAYMAAGAVAGALGLTSAIVHNRLRRKCSLQHAYEVKKRQRPYLSRWIVWMQSVSGEPRVCTQSVIAMWISLLLFLAGAASVGVGFFRSTKKQDAYVYEMQEKCGKTAREWFKQLYIDNSRREFPLNTYRNRYNTTSNACFAQVFSSTEQEPSVPWVQRTVVVDVNENREIGRITMSIQARQPVVVSVCEFDGASCRGVEQWTSQASRYMSQ